MDATVKVATEDRDLLAGVRSGDAKAFAELSQRTSGMVYATCLRVLGDAALAQDATQETFLKLLRHAGSVRGCVGAWLHRVATNQAMDLARSERRLHQRQQGVTASTAPSSWDELSGMVDEALELLPETQRILLVRHFLEGRNQEELARELQVTQPTISRQLAEALDAVRIRLRQLGVAASIAVLEVGLGAERAKPAPAALHAELGKMALTTPAASATGAFMGGMLMGGVILLLAAGVVFSARSHSIPPARTTSPMAPPVPHAGAAALLDTSSIPKEIISQALMARAVDAVCTGDATTLRLLLQDHPGLAQARVQDDTGHYSGYFHHATLLHHVSGNPLPVKIPDNVVEIARILLAAGAPVDARTDGGPTQPTDPGSTTLGLLVSCGPAMHAHIQELADVLIAAGANVDDGKGAVLGVALQYSSWDGVTALLRHGVSLDLLFASGVGDLARVQSFFTAQGGLKPGAVFLGGYPQLPHGPSESQGGYATWPHGTADAQSEQLAEALVFATAIQENPHRMEVVRFLLDHGAQPKMTVYGQTALHNAAWVGDVALCRVLLEGGADPTVADLKYKAVPAAWADHNHHPECAQAIRTWKPGSDFAPPKPRADF